MQHRCWRKPARLKWSRSLNFDDDGSNPNSKTKPTEIVNLDRTISLGEEYIWLSTTRCREVKFQVLRDGICPLKLKDSRSKVYVDTISKTWDLLYAIQFKYGVADLKVWLESRDGSITNTLVSIDNSVTRKLSFDEPIPITGYWILRLSYRSPDVVYGIDTTLPIDKLLSKVLDPTPIYTVGVLSSDFRESMSEHFLTRNAKSSDSKLTSGDLYFIKNYKSAFTVER